MNNRLRWLIWLPFSVYALSYVYLAVYHGQIGLLHTVVHEGGTYTLLQTIFYASHFLGHIPSLSVIALLFVGSVLTFQSAPPASPTRLSALTTVLPVFVVLSVVVSLSVFGRDDTVSYILQQRQGVGNDVTGGSWNLHLPSTLTLLFLLPLYMVILRVILGKPIVARSGGIPYFGVGIILILAVTALANRGSLSPLIWIWTDPRYLAHSVRELATFPLTFFPIPLYFIFRSTPAEPSLSNRPPYVLIVIFMSVILPVLVYQVFIPLSYGIGTLAQKPAFAHGNKLGILYLLSSHYFEHVLDSVYFTLLSLLLFDQAGRFSRA